MSSTPAWSTRWVPGQSGYTVRAFLKGKKKPESSQGMRLEVMAGITCMYVYPHTHTRTSDCLYFSHLQIRKQVIWALSVLKLILIILKWSLYPCLFETIALLFLWPQLPKKVSGTQSGVSYEHECAGPAGFASQGDACLALLLSCAVGTSYWCLQLITSLFFFLDFSRA